MMDTDTKPVELPVREASLPCLRVVFTIRRVLIPPILVRIPKSGVQIGREAFYDLQIDDARVSRRHAVVRRAEDGNLEVEDLGSKNGTFVNGKRALRIRIKPGDVLSVGDTCLIVSDEPVDVSEEAASPLLGFSPAIMRARAQVRRLAPTALTVLLIAETGCGKEVVASALHDASGVSGAFVAVNCAAVPDNLFESQFFGHRSGAFTGAAAAHDGFFRAAKSGTLFLDEVGELPLALQPKLLRALQERAVMPLGFTQPVPCPLRVVAATNRDLRQAVERGEFRADLLARLFEAHISLPPLRERREDILPIFTASFIGGLPPMSHALAEALLLYAWPFNVRELKASAMDLSASRTGDRPLELESFRHRMHAMAQHRACNAASVQPTKADGIGPDELTRLLREKCGSVADVARTVGRSRRQVYRWISHFGLDVDSFRRRLQ